MDIFEEARQEVRQERLYQFIKRYYKAMLVLTVLLLGSASAYTFIKYRNIRKQEELSKQYYDLFSKNPHEFKLTDSSLGELIKFRDTPLRPFAEFQYVNLAILNKDYAKAIQLLFALAETSKKRPEISNVAIVRAAELTMSHQIKNFYYKTGDLLTKATKKPDAPYYFVMKLMLGQLLIESGKTDEGLTLLRDLNKDAATPQNIKLFCAAILSNHLN